MVADPRARCRARSLTAPRRAQRARPTGSRELASLRILTHVALSGLTPSPAMPAEAGIQPIRRRQSTKRRPAALDPRFRERDDWPGLGLAFFRNSQCDLSQPLAPTRPPHPEERCAASRLEGCSRLHFFDASWNVPSLRSAQALRNAPPSAPLLRTRRLKVVFSRPIASNPLKRLKTGASFRAFPAFFRLFSHFSPPIFAFSRDFSAFSRRFSPILKASLRAPRVGLKLAPGGA